MIYEWVVEPRNDPGDVLNRQGVALSLRWAVVQKAEIPVGGQLSDGFSLVLHDGTTYVIIRCRELGCKCRATARKFL